MIRPNGDKKNSPRAASGKPWGWWLDSPHEKQNSEKWQQGVKINRAPTLQQTTVFRVITMLSLPREGGAVFFSKKMNILLSRNWVLWLIFKHCKLYCLLQYQYFLCSLLFLKKQMARVKIQFYVIHLQSKVVIFPKKHVHILGAISSNSERCGTWAQQFQIQG